jgi:hypothetical protein
VQDFAERFNAILCHARNLNNLQKAKLFVGGHPDHIRVDVAMRAPQDLPTAMYLAWAFELRANAMLAMMPAAPPRPARPVQQQPQQPVPVLLVGGAGQPAAAVPPAPHPFRRLAPTEQQEHRWQGLCYNCGESFSAVTNASASSTSRLATSLTTPTLPLSKRPRTRPRWRR